MLGPPWGLAFCGSVAGSVCVALFSCILASARFGDDVSSGMLCLPGPLTATSPWRSQASVGAPKRAEPREHVGLTFVLVVLLVAFVTKPLAGLLAQHSLCAHLTAGAP